MRQSLLTVSLLVLVFVAWMLRDLLMVVAFAALLAYALDPLVSWIERLRFPGGRHVPRAAAIGLIVVLLVSFAAATMIEAIPRLFQQLVRFAGTAPAAFARLENDVRAFIAAKSGGALQPGGSDESSSVSSLLAAVGRAATSLLGRIAGSLAGLASIVLVPLFAVYMLAAHDRARSNVLRLLPESQLPRAVRLLDSLDRALRAYVRGQALVCLVMGATMAIALGLIGFPVALLLGVAVGLGEIIPILGFWIAALAIGLEGYSKSPGLALSGLIAYAVINNLIGTFVSPRLLGRTVKLHPFVINVSVIGGGILLGPAGAILALPIAAMAKCLLDEFRPKSYRSDAARGVTTTLS